MLGQLDRIVMAQKTLQFVEQGWYISKSGKRVELPPTKPSVFWSEEDLRQLGKEPYQRMQNTKIYCSDEGVVDFVFRMQKEGVDLSTVGVLNFASALHAGGGFLNGAMAQEECIAYCSNLYDQIKGSPYYELNHQNKSPLYLHNMIESTVTFFRNSSWELVDDPATVKVITSPAVNMGRFLPAIETGKEFDYAREVMKDRMFLILCLFTEMRCKVIGLGAFGCGVFGNHPTQVAHDWEALLCFMGSAFDEVVMPVPSTNTGNYEVFSRVFGEKR